MAKITANYQIDMTVTALCGLKKDLGAGSYTPQPLSCLYQYRNKCINQSKTCECLPLHPDEKITAAATMLAIKSDVSVNCILSLCIDIELVCSDVDVIAFLHNYN